MSVIELRHATRDDVAILAEIYLESFTATLPSIQLAHSDDEIRRYFATIVIDEYEVWVAVVDSMIVGFVATRGTRIDHLYLRPAWTGRGIGRRLIELAKYRRPQGLDLWAFEINTGARRFYERNGFVAVEFTNGDGNDEGEPDVRYAWPGRSHAGAS